MYGGLHGPRLPAMCRRRIHGRVRGEMPRCYLLVPRAVQGKHRRMHVLSGVDGGALRDAGAYGSF